MPFDLLTTRKVLRLSGEDVLLFLQGLVTNDVMRLAAEGAQYAGLLTPQGKFLHGFFLYWHDGAVLLDVRADRAEDLGKRLAMYKLRSRVVIEHTDLKVAAVWGDGSCPALSGVAVADPRFAAMGWRLVGTEGVLRGVGEQMEAGSYETHRMALGVWDEAELTPEKSFPLPFGFEQLHAVDFRKGCYVGQEVTARTKHLGKLNKIVFCVRGAAVPPAGTELSEGTQVLGAMIASDGERGIAFLNAEMVEALKGRIAYGGGELSVSVPSWFKNSPEA